MDPLQIRVEAASIDRDVLIEGLASPRIAIGDPKQGYARFVICQRYTTPELANGIDMYLRRHGVRKKEHRSRRGPFRQRLLASLEKEPMKRILWGMVNAGGVPDAVFKALSFWEASYFLAGVDARKRGDPKRRRREIELFTTDYIIADTMDRGLDAMKKAHEQMATEGRTHNRMARRRKYRPRVKMPFEDRIRGRYTWDMELTRAHEEGRTTGHPHENQIKIIRPPGIVKASHGQLQLFAQ